MQNKLGKTVNQKSFMLTLPTLWDWRFRKTGNIFGKKTKREVWPRYVGTWLLPPPHMGPIQPRLLRWSRFKPCLGPGYFLLWSSDCMLETCMLLAGVMVHEHWWPIVFVPDAFSDVFWLSRRVHVQPDLQDWPGLLLRHREQGRLFSG